MLFALFQRCMSALFPILFSFFLAFSIAQAADPVGTLSGSFTVTPGGAASYNVPIKLPPGIGGMQPELSLEYSSQSGNGLLGMGWNLGGLSSITRCGKSLAQDGKVEGVTLSQSDNFCLNGARLVSINGVHGVAGTIYTTEIDSYQKIVQDEEASGCDGPCGFTVYTKAGLIYEYGYDQQATQSLAGQTTALSWSVSKLRDTLSNTITYYWQKDVNKGSQYIDRIVYTSNPNTNLMPLAEVKFKYYSQRPDPLEGYAMGKPVTTDVRLTKIIIRRGLFNQPKVREYRLAYKTQNTGNQSLLRSLTECGFNEQGQAACLKPTVFDWETPTKFYKSWVKVGSSSSFPLLKCKALPQSDVDGDGKTDLICVYESDRSGSSRSITYVKTSSSGYAQWIEWYNEGGKSTSNSFDARYCSPILSADINGDGLSDLVCSHIQNEEDISGDGYTHTETSYVQLSTGTAFEPWANWHSLSTFFYSGSQQYSFPGSCVVKVGDVNGDGRNDLICIMSYGTFVQFAQDNSMSSWQHLGSAHRKLSKCRHLSTGDVNGDGLTDNICAYDSTNSGPGSENTYVQISLGDRYTDWIHAFYGDVNNYDIEHCEDFLDGDVNGDGQQDLICIYGWNHYFIQLSKGGFGTNVSYESWQQWETDATLSDTKNNCRGGIKAIDVDVDGRTDLMCAYRQSDSETRTYVKLSTGSGFSPWEERHSGYNNQITDINTCHYVFPGETNGDGHADLICIAEEAGKVNTYIQQHTTSAPSYLLGMITDAFGNKTQIDYLPLTDSTVYFKGTDYTGGPGNAYPAPDFQGPTYVVSKASANDGVGGMSGTRYRYEGARIDRRGRGHLGFRKVISISELTGQQSITTYSQTFPSIGMPERIETWLKTARRIGLSSYKWIITRPGGTSSGRYRILPSRSEEKTFELRGGLIKTIITTNKNYDAYGNPGEVKVTTKGGGETFTQTTTNTYDNFPGPWYLGRLRQSIATTTSPTDSQTRTSTFDYFSVNGLLKTETIEPLPAANQPRLTLTKTYSYDPYGNKKAITVRGDANAAYKITPTTTRSYFDFTRIILGHYSITTTNAKGHQEVKIIDVRTGQPFSLNRLLKFDGPKSRNLFRTINSRFLTCI